MSKKIILLYILLIIVNGNCLNGEDENWKHLGYISENGKYGLLYRLDYNGTNQHLYREVVEIYDFEKQDYKCIIDLSDKARLLPFVSNNIVIYEDIVESVFSIKSININSFNDSILFSSLDGNDWLLNFISFDIEFSDSIFVIHDNTYNSFIYSYRNGKSQLLRVLKECLFPKILNDSKIMYVTYSKDKYNKTISFINIYDVKGSINTIKVSINGFVDNLNPIFHYSDSSFIYINRIDNNVWSYSLKDNIETQLTNIKPPQAVSRIQIVRDSLLYYSVQRNEKDMNPYHKILNLNDQNK